MAKGLKHQKEYFNKIAVSYHTRSEQYIKSIAKFYHVTKGYIRGKVLDIGNGGVISYETNSAKQIIIADIAPQMLQHLLKFDKGHLVPFRNQKIKKIVANVLKMPFKSKSFDTTIMITTAHHLSLNDLDETKKNIRTALSEISRVTKPGGIFIIHECFYNSILKILQEVFFESAYSLLQLINKPLPYFMSHKQLSGYLKQNGFIIIKIVNTPSSDKVYLPVFPLISPPGWIWDKILRSDVFICRKV